MYTARDELDSGNIRVHAYIYIYIYSTRELYDKNFVLCIGIC